MRNKILIAAIKSRRASSIGTDRLNRLLKGADLSGADLRGADLSGVNLSGAYLRCANLSGAKLRDAKLNCAGLRGSNLRGADLRGADLRGADLRGADLSWITLSDADLRGADLSDANLMGARGITCAACHWSDHGECGRQLLGVVINGETRLFCGCFNGDKEELVRFIATGKEHHKKSRTLAMEFVCARVEEMK